LVQDAAGAASATRGERRLKGLRAIVSANTDGNNDFSPKSLRGKIESSPFIFPI